MAIATTRTRASTWEECPYIVDDMTTSRLLVVLAAAGVDAARLEIGFAGHDLEPCQEAALDAIVEHLDEIDA